MKTVVSISQGSSEYDYELETRFLGQDFRDVRVGSDGNLDRAEAVLDSVREQADAIGLSMIHDHYQVGREQLQHPDTSRRSEEHTSELQSRPHLVCRLLLEKKNRKA